MRRGGIGDVRGEHHHALAAELKRRRVQAEELFGCHLSIPPVAAAPARSAVRGARKSTRHVAMAVPNRIFPRFSMRSEERRVGKECVSPCRSRWSPYN